MAKRFTDTEKWFDPWFRELNPKLKNCWQFLCDRCDISGVWNIDYSLMGFCINDSITDSELINGLNNGKDRVKIISPQKLQVIDFITFQYGKLTETNKMHRGVMRQIEANIDRGYEGATKGHGRGMVGAQDKVKSTVTVKVKPLKPLKEINYIILQNIEHVKLTQDQLNKLNQKFKEAPEILQQLLADLDNYIGSTGKKYKSHYHTILLWHSKNLKPKHY